MDNKYKYTYQRTANYCYKDTDVLINKLNITNDEDLFNAERELVSLRISEFNDCPIKGSFDFNYLKDIHKFLFQDVYSWAGNIRRCNIAKQDLFCLTENIKSYGNNIFSRLKKEKYYLNYDNETTLEKLAELFADINAMHPFREGNGRSQRMFIESLAKINGIYLDLTNVSKIQMIIASHESISGNCQKLIDLFKENSNAVDEEKKLEYINHYCSDKMKKYITK